MRTTILLSVAGLLGLFGLPATATPVPQQQDPSQQQQTVDPVADAARKARAKEKTEGKPKRVFTNDDMPSAPEKPATAAAPGNTDPNVNQPPGGDEKADKDKADDPKSEAYWRKRFKEAHDKLANAERELGILQRELNKNEVQYYPNPQTALTQQYNRSDINEGAAKIQAKQFEIEKLKKDISDLEDDLRKAGGDPGWAR